MKVEIYLDKARKWRWRCRARNGRIVACSGEPFASKGNAKRAWKRFEASVRDGGDGSYCPVQIVYPDAEGAK